MSHSVIKFGAVILCLSLAFPLTANAAGFRHLLESCAAKLGMGDKIMSADAVNEELNKFTLFWHTLMQRDLLIKATKLETDWMPRDFSEVGYHAVIRMTYDLPNGINIVVEIPSRKSWNKLMVRRSLEGNFGLRDELWRDNSQKITVSAPNSEFTPAKLELITEGIRAKAEKFARSEEAVPMRERPQADFQLLRMKSDDPLISENQSNQVILRSFVGEWTHLFVFLQAANVVVDEYGKLKSFK
jgi:hypothetical protein